MLFMRNSTKNFSNFCSELLKIIRTYSPLSVIFFSVHNITVLPSDKFRMVIAAINASEKRC